MKIQKKSTKELVSIKSPKRNIEPKESLNMCVFKSGKNGIFEDWRDSMEKSNNVTAVISSYELQDFFDSLYDIRSYDIAETYRLYSGYTLICLIIWILWFIVTIALIYYFHQLKEYLLPIILVFIGQLFVFIQCNISCYNKEIKSRLEDQLERIDLYNLNCLRERGLLLKQLGKGKWQILETTENNHDKLNLSFSSEGNINCYTISNSVEINNNLGIIDPSSKMRADTWNRHSDGDENNKSPTKITNRQVSNRSEKDMQTINSVADSDRKKLTTFNRTSPKSLKIRKAQFKTEKISDNA